MNFAKPGVNVAPVQLSIRLVVHVIQMKSHMKSALTQLLTESTVSSTVTIALSITANATKTLQMHWLMPLIVWTLISLQTQTAAVSIMWTSARQLQLQLKTLTETGNIQTQTTIKMKFNAVERTQIDSLSIHNPRTVMDHEVAAEMWLTIRTNVNAVLTHS